VSIRSLLRFSRRKRNLRHIVMKDRLLVVLHPPDRDPRPVRFDDRAVVIAVRIPANAVADFKLSRIVAVHSCSLPFFRVGLTCNGLASAEVTLAGPILSVPA
jgi:hypothetical protein